MINFGGNPRISALLGIQKESIYAQIAAGLNNIK